MFFNNILARLFTLGFLMIFASAEAQDYSITGKITDDENTPLESATVYVEAIKDSSLVDYTISDVDGKFNIEGNTKAKKINLLVSFTGFQTFKKAYNLAENPNLETGNIVLNLADNELDEVLVKGIKAPVSVKTDTLEFNAASFKTKADANLEEVLKKLPGVQVDSDGKITVNGKPVSRVLVNGKEFFGDDPKIATKNLPKEIIDKIQVVDTKTKSEEFTGKEGDSENKTLNITIDEEKNKGYFARLTAGAGTDERYELSGVANYFKDNLRVSVLGSSNNINASGFSFDEVFDAMGRSAYSIRRSSDGSFSINSNSFGGGNGGITKSDNGGLSFVNEWPDKTELSANYFFNRANTKTETTINRENILPDRIFYNNSNSSSRRQNDNHRARLGFEVQPDTLTRISFRPSFNVNNGFVTSNSFTNSVEENGNPINTAKTEAFTEVFTTNFSNRFNITRKFGRQGGFVSLAFANKNNTSQEDKVYYSSREIFDNGNLESTEEQNQLIAQNAKTDEYAIRANARLPLDERFSLDLAYAYTKTNEQNERLVFEKNEISTEYDLLQEDLSSDFISENFNHRPNIGLVYRDNKLRASISGGLENVRLQNKDLLSDTAFENTYNNIYSRAYFRYKINKTKSVYFNYRNSRNTPSISQLQPVFNTTNPLNIIVGNPNLNPSLRHNFYMNFTNYDFKTRSGFYAYVNGNLTNSKVVPITTTSQDLVRTTTYTNIDGAYNLSAAASLDKTYTLKNKNTIKIDAGISGRLSKDLGFSNAVKFESERYSINPNLGVQYDIIDKLTIEPSYDLSFVNATYSLNQARDESYINHDINLEITSYWPKNVVFGNDISYRHLGNISPGFKNNYVLWNMSLGYKLLGDDGIFKVKVFDVLDQNVSTQRTTGEDFVQDTQQLVLERYMMFSFTYKLSKFGGKKPNRHTWF